MSLEAGTRLGQYEIIAPPGAGGMGEVYRARATRLEQAGALPAKKAVQIAADLARGLAAAHDKHIAHRDLKPENVFLLGDGQGDWHFTGRCTGRPRDLRRSGSGRRGCLDA